MKSKIKIYTVISILIFQFAFCSLVATNQIEESNSEIEIENQIPKTISETEIQYLNSSDDGRLEGDEVEACGYASLESMPEIEQEKLEPYWPLTNEERKIICYVVAGESKAEPMEGKMAVAQSYMNGMIRSGTSVAETRIEYQYSGYDSKLQYSDNPISQEAWAEVQEAVSRVFDNGERVSEEFILWFHNDKVNPKFHKTQKFVIQIGHHLFYAPWELPENAKPYYEGE